MHHVISIQRIERAADFDIENTIAATEMMYRDLVRGREYTSTKSEDH